MVPWQKWQSRVLCDLCSFSHELQFSTPMIWFDFRVHVVHGVTQIVNFWHAINQGTGLKTPAVFLWLFLMPCNLNTHVPKEIFLIMWWNKYQDLNLKYYHSDIKYQKVLITMNGAVVFYYYTYLIISTELVTCK